MLLYNYVPRRVKFHQNILQRHAHGVRESKRGGHQKSAQTHASDPRPSHPSTSLVSRTFSRKVLRTRTFCKNHPYVCTVVGKRSVARHTKPRVAKVNGSSDTPTAPRPVSSSGTGCDTRNSCSSLRAYVGGLGALTSTLNCNTRSMIRYCVSKIAFYCSQS